MVSRSPPPRLPSQSLRLMPQRYGDVFWKNLSQRPSLTWLEEQHIPPMLVRQALCLQQFSVKIAPTAVLSQALLITASLWYSPTSALPFYESVIMFSRYHRGLPKTPDSLPSSIQAPLREPVLFSSSFSPFSGTESHWLLPAWSVSS